ncbi:MAG: hypothetical protein BWX64_00052 [Acidobacteria bacterium ADurb.Bin051]|nr:MAG: hypothetical protein BWX64_00052 [Acidobacteria bacterium ADurb.Bin051]
MGGVPLPLHLVMVHHRPGGGDELGDRAGEVALSVAADVPLDEPELAPLAGEQEHAGEGGGRLPLLGVAEEEQVDRTLDHGAGRRPHERPVGEEGGVEVGEGVLVAIGHPAELGEEAVGAAREKRAEPADLESGRQLV